MSAPIVKHRDRDTHKQTALLSSDLCPRCGQLGHLISDHVEEKGRMCTKCSCVAQDVAGF